MSKIVIAGTFDSKAGPLNALRKAIRDLGEEPVMIDISVYPKDNDWDFPASAVADRIDVDIRTLADRGRAEATSIMADAASVILSELGAEGQVGALVCMGGTGASSSFTRLAPLLPLGIPKILMSTAVATDTRPLVGSNDVVLIYPITDVEGDNAILRQMILRAAKTAVALKSNVPLAVSNSSERAVALSMYGVTTPCVSRVSDLFAQASFEPYVFHANGTGGRTLETFAQQGLVEGVADITISELTDELFGGMFGAGSDRLTNVAKAGLPQVLAPGAIDMICYGRRRTVPETLDNREILAHNDLVTLVRTTADECHELGQVAAKRIGNPSASTAIVVPLGGVSMLDKPDAPFWDPDAVRAFRDGVLEAKAASVEVIESDDNINDPAFADLLFNTLRDAMA
ncbi:MAG: Tm-1-like ATP-binding domain-containing protein [Alphaproteobacteria bacterium]|nr:Tm-1-like ATP-binding domain-containing protein [Alphaproteobacteria bacterium]